MKTRLAFIAILLWAMPVSAQSITMPVHGNWCGIGHSGGAYAQPPTDPLDAACMRHDICTGQRGRFNCGCDINLMLEVRAQSWPNPGLQAKARAIYDTIALVPCSNANGMTIKGEMVMNDWIEGVVTGREAPWDILQRLGLMSREGVQSFGWQP